MQQCHKSLYRFSEYNYFPMITHFATPAAVSITGAATWCALRNVYYIRRTQTTKINDTYKLKGKHLILYYVVWWHPPPLLLLFPLFLHGQPHLFDGRYHSTRSGSATTKKSGHPASQTFVWLKLNLKWFSESVIQGRILNTKGARTILRWNCSKKYFRKLKILCLI